MNGKHQIKLVEALEGGHVALSRKDGSFQVFRAFSAGDGKALLDWIASELNIEIAAPPPAILPPVDGVFRGPLVIDWDAVMKSEEPAPPLPAVPAETVVLASQPRRQVRSRAEKMQAFVDLVAERSAGGFVRLPLTKLRDWLGMKDSQTIPAIRDAIAAGLVEKREELEGGHRHFAYRLVTLGPTQQIADRPPEEGASSHDAMAAEPEGVAAPPAPEPPVAQAVKSSVEQDMDTFLEKRAAQVLECLRGIADRQGQQQFEVQLTKLADRAGVAKASMPAIIAVLRRNGVIVREPLQRGWGWRFDLSAVATVESEAAQ